VLQTASPPVIPITAIRISQREAISLVHQCGTRPRAFRRHEEDGESPGSLIRPPSVALTLPCVARWPRQPALSGNHARA
jgi:hypothetical protein